MLYAHDVEVMAMDTCKYNPFVFSTGAVDGAIKLWVMRLMFAVLK